MALPGLLVEYLITGSCAIVWIWLLLSVIMPDRVLTVASLDVSHATLAAPLAYVAGMVIDYVGRLMATPLRHFIADPVNERLAPAIAARLSSRWVSAQKFLRNGQGHDDDLAQAEISYLSPELGRQFEMRSSRDRVARGVFANVVIAATVGGFFRSDMSPLIAAVWMNVTTVLMLLTFAVWYRLHALTELFARSAAQLLREKRRSELEVVGS